MEHSRQSQEQAKEIRSGRDREVFAAERREARKRDLAVQKEDVIKPGGAAQVALPDTIATPKRVSQRTSGRVSRTMPKTSAAIPEEGARASRKHLI